MNSRIRPLLSGAGLAFASLLFSSNASAVECNQTHSPVCGEDGKTYKNGCLAFAANVRTVHDGQCGSGAIPATLPPKGAEGPSEPAKYCVIDTGDKQDSAVAEVTCSTHPTPAPEPIPAPLPQPEPEPLPEPIPQPTPPPPSCSETYNPVCGTNGRNYFNACHAQQANTGIAFDGICQTTTTTSTVCEGDDQAVCGEDGATYYNACTAKRVGIKVAAQGACQIAEPAPLPEPEPSPEPSPEPLAEPIETPAICSSASAPVCGVDGNTYQNTCYALQAETTVASAGSCESRVTTTEVPVVPVETHSHTHASTHTDIHVSGSYYSGKYYPYPPAFRYGYSYSYPYYSTSCSGLSRPVCGRDGYTYRNSCYANQAGVSVRYRGRCQTRHNYHGYGYGYGHKYPRNRCSSRRSPVCGNNGVTYRNGCKARRAGVAVSYRGRCSSSHRQYRRDHSSHSGHRSSQHRSSNRQHRRNQSSHSGHRSSQHRSSNRQHRRNQSSHSGHRSSQHRSSNRQHRRNQSSHPGQRGNQHRSGNRQHRRNQSSHSGQRSSQHRSSNRQHRRNQTSHSGQRSSQHRSSNRQHRRNQTSHSGQRSSQRRSENRQHRRSHSSHSSQYRSGGAPKQHEKRMLAPFK